MPKNLISLLELIRFNTDDSVVQCRLLLGSP